MGKSAPKTAELSPLSQAIPVIALPSHGRDVEFTATDKELEAIANMFGLISANSLSANFHITKGAGSLIAVQGSLTAEVVQTCGVTLEPVQERVATDIAMSFTLDPDAASADVNVAIDEEDPPEPVIDGHIDFGALALEHLALNLNPYPRSPDAHFENIASRSKEEQADSADSGLFSALAKLQKAEK